LPGLKLSDVIILKKKGFGYENITIANSTLFFSVKEETSITLKKKSRGVGHRSQRIKKFGSNVS